jgi:hypothetical protein
MINGVACASDLGPCCICGGPHAVVIIMLERRGPIPGRGWGCVQCGLPCDGAVAVICERCEPRWRINPASLAHCCRGWPASDGRVPIAELPPGVFDHDMTKHPEAT